MQDGWRDGQARGWLSMEMEGWGAGGRTKGVSGDGWSDEGGDGGMDTRMSADRRPVLPLSPHLPSPTASLPPTSISPFSFVGPRGSARLGSARTLGPGTWVVREAAALSRLHTLMRRRSFF